MKKLLDSWLIFVFSVGPLLLPVSVLAKSSAHYHVELGGNQQIYTYVFSGTVINKGHPCPNAKIYVTLSTDSEPDRFQETVANADGSYILKVKVAGGENEAALWTLVARAPDTSTLDTVEIQGSAILTLDQDTVMVQRPIQLAQL